MESTLEVLRGADQFAPTAEYMNAERLRETQLLAELERKMLAKYLGSKQK